MASPVWYGGAAAVGQVQTWMFAGTWTVGDVVTVVVGYKTWKYAITNSTIATFLPLLQAAYAAIDPTIYPELAEQTASNTATTLVLTANKAGKPFTATLSTNSAAGTINGGSTATPGTATVVSSGPNDWSTAANWSLGAVPVTGDTVTIDRDMTTGNTQILYGLSQAAVTLAELRLSMPQGTDTLGLPVINQDGGTTYPEYRPTYLAIGATLCTVQSGSGRIKVNFGSVATTFNGDATGSGLDSGIPACLLQGTSSSNVWYFNAGQYGGAFFGGDSINLANCQLGQMGGGSGDVTVVAGYGATLGVLAVYSGTFVGTTAVATSLLVYGGSVTLNGVGAVAQLTVYGGITVLNTSGALNGNTILYAPGIIDYSQDRRSKTITNPVKSYGGSTGINDPYGVITRPWTVNLYGPTAFGVSCKLTVDAAS